MARKWKALVVWIAVPYLFDSFIVPGIEAISSQSGPAADWWSWVFSSRALIAGLLWCVIPAGIGTAILWLLPIRRFWVGTIVGALVAAALIAIVARITMALYGGFEENMEIELEVFNLLLPSCCAGAFAGFLRFRDGQTASSALPGSTAEAAGAHYPRARYILAITILFFVMAGIWLAWMGRLRQWW